MLSRVKKVYLIKNCDEQKQKSGRNKKSCYKIDNEMLLSCLKDNKHVKCRFEEYDTVLFITFTKKNGSKIYF